MKWKIKIIMKKETKKGKKMKTWKTMVRRKKSMKMVKPATKQKMKI